QPQAEGESDWTWHGPAAGREGSALAHLDSTSRGGGDEGQTARGAPPDFGGTPGAAASAGHGRTSAGPATRTRWAAARSPRVATRTASTIHTKQKSSVRARFIPTAAPVSTRWDPRANPTRAGLRLRWTQTAAARTGTRS